jgi:hypothetical protein
MEKLPERDKEVSLIVVQCDMIEELWEKRNCEKQCKPADGKTYFENAPSRTGL